MFLYISMQLIQCIIYCGSMLAAQKVPAVGFPQPLDHQGSNFQCSCRYSVTTSYMMQEMNIPQDQGRMYYLQIFFSFLRITCRSFSFCFTMLFCFLLCYYFFSPGFQYPFSVTIIFSWTYANGYIHQAGRCVPL